MSIEIQEEICKIEAENKNKEILLNVIDKVVRRIIKDENKANYLIQRLVTAFLEITEGNNKEEKLSVEKERRRLKVRTLAIREKKHNKYVQEKLDFRKAMEIENKRNKKIALETLERLKEGKEKKEKKVETFDELMERLLRTRMEAEEAGIG